MVLAVSSDFIDGGCENQVAAETSIPYGARPTVFYGRNARRRLPAVPAPAAETTDHKTDKPDDKQSKRYPEQKLNGESQAEDNGHQYEEQDQRKHIRSFLSQKALLKPSPNRSADKPTAHEKIQGRTDCEEPVVLGPPGPGRPINGPAKRERLFFAHRELGNRRVITWP
jgi:hypothetical protein